MRLKLNKKVLPGLPEPQSDYEAIEQRIKKFFREELYLPLLILATPKRILRNSSHDLLTAIQSGLITFQQGHFRGSFSAETSRELKRLGAKWAKRTISFKIHKSELPVDVLNAISMSESNFLRSMNRVDRHLAQILPDKIAEKLKTADLFDRTLFKTDNKIQSQLKAITVSPRLSKEQRAEISRDWQNNMNLYVSNFLEKEIVSMRKMVQKSVLSGNRYEALIKPILKIKQVSDDKAKFLARQETHLLLAKFKEVRYREAGAKKYVWTCVHNAKDKTPSQHTPGNVRYSHGILDGKEFSWDHPPITSNPGQPVRRNHPGQDYNCRCNARPIVEF